MPRLFWPWILGCAVGCATTAPEVRPVRGQVELDGAVIRAHPDPLTGLSHYDAALLFHLAADAERADRHDDAEAIYVRLLQEFPESRAAIPAHFNLGLLYERKQHFQDAAAHYRIITAPPVPVEDPSRRTWVDAHYRLAVCLSKAGDHWGAVDIFDALTDLPWLEDFDRLEALVGRGIEIQEAGDAEGADMALASALRFFREAEDRSHLADAGLAAEAAFRLGEIAHARFSQITLKFPQAVLEQRLNEKCELLLSAQNRYLRAIRYGDAHTVAAAGYQIGSLYESLYDMVTGLGAPQDLTPEQAEIYHEEVHKRVGVLLKKALVIYEKALLVGKRAPTAATWVERIEAAAERLRALYLADEDNWYSQAEFDADPRFIP